MSWLVSGAINLDFPKFELRAGAVGSRPEAPRFAPTKAVRPGKVCLLRESVKATQIALATRLATCMRHVLLRHASRFVGVCKGRFAAFLSADQSVHDDLRLRWNEDFKQVATGEVKRLDAILTRNLVLILKRACLVLENHLILFRAAKADVKRVL